MQPMDMEDPIRTKTDSEEEEEDDDEMIMLIAPALYAASTKTKIPCHTSKLSGAEYTSEILEGHKRRSYENLRMEPRIFKAVSEYVRKDRLEDRITALHQIVSPFGKFLATDFFPR